MYGVPFGDKQLLRIDPSAGTVSRVGPPLQDKDRGKLGGHATAADGTVWALPHNCPVAPHRIDLPPVRQLLAAGADPAIKNAMGMTAAEATRWYLRGSLPPLLAQALGELR